MEKTGNERFTLSSKDYYSKENSCRFLFDELCKRYGALWHIYTSGKEQEFYNTCAEDYIFSINNIALSADECGVALFTDSHMENHIHLLAGGTKEQCEQMLTLYANRIKQRARKQGRGNLDISGIRCDNPTQVSSLESMRNVIVYINRNGYVHNENYTPFSYPWSGGFLFYNYHPFYDSVGVPWNDSPYRMKREISLRSNQKVFGPIKVEKNMIVQRSYLKITEAERMFRDSHHYLQALTKDLSFITDKSLNKIESTMVTREELFRLVCMISKEKYNNPQPSQLPMSEKAKVAKFVKTQYHAPNAFIRSILRLTEQDIVSIFSEGI